MNFKTERIKDFYLLATEVENIFINEYLPQAPGDYVKVYLYALLYAKQQTEITHHGLAVQLGLKDSDVDLAWQYWERMGVVKREMRSDAELDYGITFVNLRELMYAGSLETPQKASKSSDALCEDALREIFDFVENLKGQPVSPKEMQEIASWHSEMPAGPGLIQKAFEKLIQNKTVIMIAHRLSTIRNADQILVMEHGQLIEQGTHDTLMERQGKYTQMWNSYMESISWKIRAGKGGAIE